MRKIYHIVVLIVLSVGTLCPSLFGEDSSRNMPCTLPLESGQNDTVPLATLPCSYSSDSYDEACVEYTLKLVLLQESFDNDTLPAGWSVVDNDGDGYTWDTHTPRSIYAKHTGAGCVSSASFVNNHGALTPDNWLITPAIVIPDSGIATLSWWATAQDLRFMAEHYELYISTQSSALADFDTIPVYEDTLSSARDYRPHTLDLTAYMGQTVYVAFVHNKCNDQYWLNLDDIMVEFSPFDSVRTESGAYSYIRIDDQGCVDSVNLHYTVHPIYNQSESVAICQNDLPYTWRDTVFDVDMSQDSPILPGGDYVFYRQSVAGCDSVVTLHLTINHSSYQDVYLTISENDLPYTYGDTTFEPGTVLSGVYPFNFMTVDGCDSIIMLHLTVETSIESKVMNASLNVYPNPTTGKVNVRLTMYNQQLDNVEIQLFDMYGKRLNTWQMTGEVTEIDLSSYAAGVYFIKAVHDHNVMGIRKVLRQ